MFVPMDTVEANYPQKQTTTNPLMIRYHVYSRRVRTMLYLGGVLQDRTHSAIRTYIVGFSIILMSLNHCISLINLSRDHTDNLMLMVKYFSQIFSFIAPALMVLHLKYPISLYQKISFLQVPLYFVIFNGI